MSYGYRSRGPNRFYEQGYQDLGNVRHPSDPHDSHFEEDGLDGDFSDEIGGYMRYILLHVPFNPNRTEAYTSPAPAGQGGYSSHSHNMQFAPQPYDDIDRYDDDEYTAQSHDENLYYRPNTGAMSSREPDSFRTSGPWKYSQDSQSSNPGSSLPFCATFYAN